MKQNNHKESGPCSVWASTKVRECSTSPSLLDAGIDSLSLTSSSAVLAFTGGNTHLKLPAALSLEDRKKTALRGSIQGDFRLEENDKEEGEPVAVFLEVMVNGRGEEDISLVETASRKRWKTKRKKPYNVYLLFIYKHWLNNDSIILALWWGTWFPAPESEIIGRRGLRGRIYMDWSLSLSLWVLYLE